MTDLNSTQPFKNDPEEPKESIHEDARPSEYPVGGDIRPSEVRSPEDLLPEILLIPEPPELPERPVIPDPPEAHFEPPSLHRPAPRLETQTMRSVGLAASIGVMMVAPVVVGVAIGLWLDNRFKTSPTFTVILLLIGIISGFVQMIRILQRIEQEEKHEKK